MKLSINDFKSNLVRSGWLVATIIALVLSTSSLMIRHQIDKQFNDVLLITDYDDLLLLCNYSGLSMPEMLKELSDKGQIGAVAVNMCTVESALAKGYIIEKIKTPKSELPSLVEQTITANEYPLTEFDILSKEMSDGIEPFFSLIYGTGMSTNAPMFLPSTERANGSIYIPVDINRKALKFPLGFNLKEIQNVQEAGLLVVPRLINSPAVDKDDLPQYLNTVIPSNSLFLSAGESVFGYPNLIGPFANYIRSNNCNYGILEFDPQLGSDNLSAQLKDYGYIIHSISQAEMAKNSPASCIARFIRAVRERSIRICYIRPYLLEYPNIMLAGTTIADSTALWTFNKDVYFNGLATDLIKYGFNVGKTLPTYNKVSDYYYQPTVVQLLIALLSLGLILYTMTLVFSIGEDLEIWLSIGAVLLVVVGGVVKPLLIIKLVALAVAICSPVLAILLAYKWLQREKKPTSIISVTTSFLIVVGINAILASMIYGMLSTPGALNKMTSFSGIQIALALPIVITVIWSWDNSNLNTTQTIWNRLQNLVRARVTFGDALAAVLALVFIAIKLLRSGNDTPIAPSSMELAFRGLLEQLMFARPRSTELIGLPLLMCGLYLINYRNLFASICLVIGMMALTSQVNSFCHLHTPIGLTVIREILGIVTGLIFGVILILLLRNFRWRPTLRR